MARANAAVEVHGIMHAIAGHGEDDTVCASVEKYELGAIAVLWTQTAGLHIPRTNFAPTAIDSSVYVAGGCDAGRREFGSLEKYDTLGAGGCGKL